MFPMSTQPLSPPNTKLTPLVGSGEETAEVGAEDDADEDEDAVGASNEGRSSCSCGGTEGSEELLASPAGLPSSTTSLWCGRGMGTLFTPLALSQIGRAHV